MNSLEKINLEHFTAVVSRHFDFVLLFSFNVKKKQRQARTILQFWPNRAAVGSTHETLCLLWENISRLLTLLIITVAILIICIR